MYIILAPYNADKMLIFQTYNESVLEVDLGICGAYYFPDISFFDGNAYAIPIEDSTSMLRINLSLLQLSIHEAIQVQGMPWVLLQSIAERNIHALEQGDPNTALLPFMITAESRDNHDEVGSLESLTLTFELLSLKPAVMNHYVSDSQLKSDIQKGGDEEKRRRLT